MSRREPSASSLPKEPGRLGGFVLVVGRRFYADQGLVWASALAYASLLSMVPLMAVMFAVLKGLGVQGRLEGLLLSRLSLSPEATDTIIGFVDRINVGTLGGLGAALLLLTVISVLGGIESSFNHVWRVSRNRTVFRKVTDYLSVVLLTPFLMLAGVALTSSMQVDRVMQWLLDSPLIGPAAVFGLQLVPIGINVIALGVLYALMPNRRPSFVAVGVGALFAGVAWHLVQLAYIRFQIGMANYSAIYGALSQLPITLVWLYVSWAVVLLGAEIAAVYEFGWEHLGEPAVLDDAAVALHVLTRAAESFRDGGRGVEPVRAARDLGVSMESMITVLDSLRTKGWLVGAESGNFVLGRDPALIDLGEIAGLRGVRHLPRGVDANVRRALQRFAEDERGLWSARTLADVLAADDDR